MLFDNGIFCFICSCYCHNVCTYVHLVYIYWVYVHMYLLQECLLIFFLYRVFHVVTGFVHPAAARFVEGANWKETQKIFTIALWSVISVSVYVSYLEYKNAALNCIIVIAMNFLNNFNMLNISVAAHTRCVKLESPTPKGVWFCDSSCEQVVFE